MRALASLAVAIPLLLLAGTASKAYAEDEVVLLGLRSVEGDDAFANQLTSALRKEAAQLKELKFSERALSLTQMTMAHGCEELDATCLRDIAEGLQASQVVFGTIQRSSARDDYDYRVNLGLFRADTSSIENTVSGTFESSPVTASALTAGAKTLLSKLTGRRQPVKPSAQNGGILVRTNVPSAEVQLDGEPVGRTEDGSLVLEDIAPGEHSIAVLGEGHEPYQESVMVGSGAQSAVVVVLQAQQGSSAPPPVLDQGQQDDSWKPPEWLGWTLVGVAGAALTGTLVSWLWINSIEDDEDFKDYREDVGESNAGAGDICAEAEAGRPYGPSSSDEVQDRLSNVQDMCGRSDVLEVLQWVFLGTAVVAGGAGAYILLTAEDEDQAPDGAQAGAVMLRPSFGQRSAGLSAKMLF